MQSKTTLPLQCKMAGRLHIKHYYFILPTSARKVYRSINLESILSLICLGIVKSNCRFIEDEIASDWIIFINISEREGLVVASIIRNNEWSTSR